MTGWTAQAELLADAIREPGMKAAEVTASAWRAGVHPEATNGLVGAALALTDGQAEASLWAQVPPCPDDKTLLGQAAELEGAVSELLGHARRLAAAGRDSLDAAASSASRAAVAIAGDAGLPVKAAAQDELAETRREIADCGAALEILDGTGGRLEHALRCLRRVPDDFAQHYEIPRLHIRQQGALPVSGAFLTAA